MSDSLSPDFREKSRSVRQEARGYIERLRAERLAQPRWRPSRVEINAAMPCAHPKTPSYSALYVGGVRFVPDATSEAPEPVIALDEAVAEAGYADQPHADEQTAIDEDACEKLTDVLQAEELGLDTQTSDPSMPQVNAPEASDTICAPELENDDASVASEPVKMRSQTKRLRIPAVNGRLPHKTRLPTHAKKSDRSTLPLTDIEGLGAGLIWRLNQIGIKTVGSLARADHATLATRLGAAGRILNTQMLVTRAGQALAHREADGQ
jgi:predicted flap endonuclease-1-like 5' DNA nuclease